MCIDAGLRALDHGRMRFLRQKPKPVQRCPICRERLPDGAERCDMCGAVLRAGEDEVDEGRKSVRALPSRDAALGPRR